MHLAELLAQRLHQFARLLFMYVFETLPMQVVHDETLERLIHDLDELIHCDRQFISMSEELLFRWRPLAQLMNDRLRTALGTPSPPASSSSST